MAKKKLCAIFNVDSITTEKAYIVNRFPMKWKPFISRMLNRKSNQPYQRCLFEPRHQSEPRTLNVLSKPFVVWRGGLFIPFVACLGELYRFFFAFHCLNCTLNCILLPFKLYTSTWCPLLLITRSSLVTREESRV